MFVNHCLKLEGFPRIALILCSISCFFLQMLSNLFMASLIRDWYFQCVPLYLLCILCFSVSPFYSHNSGLFHWHQSYFTMRHPNEAPLKDVGELFGLYMHVYFMVHTVAYAPVPQWSVMRSRLVISITNYSADICSHWQICQWDIHRVKSYSGSSSSVITNFHEYKRHLAAHLLVDVTQQVKSPISFLLYLIWISCKVLLQSYWNQSSKNPIPYLIRFVPL